MAQIFPGMRRRVEQWAPEHARIKICGNPRDPRSKSFLF
jgi:hypothetical protein